MKKYYYTDGHILVMENDVVLVKENSKRHYIVQLNVGMSSGTCAVMEIDNPINGFFKYPINELIFVTREFFDPEEIMA